MARTSKPKPTPTAKQPANRLAPERWTHDEPAAPLLTVHRKIATGEQRTVETGGAADKRLRASDEWCTTTLGTDCDVS